MFSAISEHHTFSMTSLKRSLVQPSSTSHSLLPLHQSPFDSLATETIEEIFTFTLDKDISIPAPPIPFRKGLYVPIPFHFILGLVCKRWLATVLAHQTLWATFDIGIVELRDLRRFSFLLHKFLQNSGSHPLKIRVKGPQRYESITEILEAIMVHSERWESIEFHFPMECHWLWKLDAVRDRIPILQYLHLTGPDHVYPTEIQECAPFRNAPSLKRISLTRTDMDKTSQLKLPWDQILHATLDRSGFEKLLSVLQTVPTIIIRQVDKDFRALMDRAIPPTTLDKLQVLCGITTTTIGSLTCPSLKWLEAYTKYGSSQEMVKFLDNFSGSLIHLELQCTENRYYDPIDIPQILQHASLAGLTFLHLAPRLLTDPILDILILDSRKQLPVLETLSLDLLFDLTQRYYICYFRPLIEGLHNIVQSRTYSTTCAVKSSPETLLESSMQNATGRPLKACFFRFTAQGVVWDKWQDEKLECLRSFCISRNILVAVQLFKSGVTPSWEY